MGQQCFDIDINFGMPTYGTIPRVATAEGRERIPSEIFSATITRSRLDRFHHVSEFVGSHAFRLACVNVRTDIVSFSI